MKEQIAKWLFENKHRLPNKMFYAHWSDEIKAAPFVKEEWLKLADELLQSLAATPDSELELSNDEIENAICSKCDCEDKLSEQCTLCETGLIAITQLTVKKVHPILSARVELAKQEAKEQELREWLIALTRATQLPNVYIEGDKVKCVKGLFDLVQSEAKQAGRQEVIDFLKPDENELGFVEISNHIPYSDLKQLLEG